MNMASGLYSLITSVGIITPPRFKTAIAGIFLTLATLSCTAIDVGQLPTGQEAGDMNLSPFYRWEGPLPVKPGILLREEAIPNQQGIDTASEAVRILHSSTDVRWHSGQVPVSGALYLPTGTPPAGGWPLLAWGHGTLGIADICAPSWTNHKARDAKYLDTWLEAGFAVVTTDYQGLGGPGPHPYLYWQAAGRSILDSIRAALTARPELISNRIIIAGQSQGSGAALGAAKLAGEYAPELNVLGIVATGANSTFPDGPVSLPIRNSNNFFLSLAAGGLRDDGPQIEELVNSKGKQLLDTARMACTKDIGKLAHKLQMSKLADAFSITLEQLAPMRLPVTDIPMDTIDIPYLIATGLADDTVIPYRQYAIVAALCTSDNNVTWLKYEGLGHDEALNGSFEDSLTFARSRLEGVNVTGNCSMISPPEAPQ